MAQWFVMVHVQQHEHFKVHFIVLHSNFSPQPSALYIQPYLQYTWYLYNDKNLTVLKAAPSLWTSYCSVELSTRRQTLAYLMLRFSESCLRKYGRIPWTMDGIVTRPPPTWDDKIWEKIHLCAKRDLNPLSQGSNCRRQYSACQYFTAYSQKQIPIFSSLGRIHLTLPQTNRGEVQFVVWLCFEQIVS